MLSSIHYPHINQINCDFVRYSSYCMGSTSTSLNERMGYAYYALNDLSLSTTKDISHEKKNKKEKEISKLLHIEK